MEFSRQEFFAENEKAQFATQCRREKIRDNRREIKFIDLPMNPTCRALQKHVDNTWSNNLAAIHNLNFLNFKLFSGYEILLEKMGAIAAIQSDPVAQEIFQKRVNTSNEH